MRNLKPFYIIILLLLCLLCTPCAMAQEKGEILIGTHLPLTGMLAGIGAEQRWAYQEAVRDINRDGGIYVKQYDKKLPVRLIIVDDKTNPGLAAAAVERLIVQDKVDFILSGHTAAFGVIPGCVTAEKYKVYYHATGCFIPVWAEHKFRYSTLLFFDLDQATSVPFEIWDTFPAEQRPQRTALLAEDTFDARVMCDTFQINADKWGYNIELEMYWVPHNKNFDAIILALQAAQIDSLFVFGTITDCIRLIDQVRNADLDLKYIHCWRGAWSPKFWEALGDKAQYVFFDGHWSADYPFEGAALLGKRFQSEFAETSVSVGSFYATAQILFKAIEHAGVLDAQKVRQAVIKYKYDTVLGEIDYDDTGVGIFPCTASQWVDGKQKLVYPFNLAIDKPVLLP